MENYTALTQFIEERVQDSKFQTRKKIQRNYELNCYSKN